MMMIKVFKTTLGMQKYQVQKSKAEQQIEALLPGGHSSPFREPVVAGSGSLPVRDPAGGRGPRLVCKTACIRRSTCWDQKLSEAAANAENMA